MGAYPWDVVLEASPSEEGLLRIFQDDSIESRLRLLAAHRLRSVGLGPPGKQLLGVVAEVGMDEGLDTLAAFADGTARYINYTEKMIVWESRTAESDDLVSKLLSAGWVIAREIGPWEDERLPAPTAGNARISFLVSDGLYFGEAPFGVLQQDPLGGAVLNAAAALMGFLVNTSLGQSQ
jgi:hypothetical protein